MVIALAGFVTVGALPAAATPATVQYVALGDSYAAGTAIQPCTQSSIGYPALLDSDKRIHLQANAACSGATISDVAAQLSALNPGTRLVTLTVGAANLGLSAVLAACLPVTDRCVSAIANAKALLGDCSEDQSSSSSLDRPLAELYAEVADAAPRARIVVTGYPLLFGPPADPLLDPTIITAINEATTDLNCVIERAVKAAALNGENIRYVDVTEEFAGHGIVTRCTGSSAFIHSLFICDPPPPSTDSEAFHPTTAGYVAYADAISAALDPWLDEQAQLV